MKYKHLALTISLSVIFTGSVLAGNSKELDKSTPKMPQNASQVSGLDSETEVIENTTTQTSGVKATDYNSSRSNKADSSKKPAHEKGSGMATGKREHKPVNTSKRIDKASPVSSSASDVYIKIDDIKGETGKKETTTVVPDRIEFKKTAIPPSITALEVTAPSQISEKDTEKACDALEKSATKAQKEACHRGHVTVLK